MTTKRLLRTVTVVAVAVLGVAALGAPAAQAQASVSRSEQTVDVVDFPAMVGSCVNAGQGEVILLSGTLHSFTTLRDDATGGFHVTLHSNLTNMSGVGASSGIVYRVTDTGRGFGSRLDAYFPPGSPGPRVVTGSSSIRFISAGSAYNLLIRDTFHVTMNANGDITVDKPSFELICVG